jgi:hypothetical protein
MKHHAAVIRDHEKIAQKYFKEKFFFDALALLPIQWLKFDRDRQRYLFIIKLVRLKQGLDNFDINSILKRYKSHQRGQLEELIQRDPIAGNSKIEDHTNIGKILAMSYFLKTLKLILVITSCSYFFAMLFKILIEIQGDLMNLDEYNTDPSHDSEPEHFTEFYDL